MKKLFLLAFIFFNFTVFSQVDTMIWEPAGTYPDIPTVAIYNNAVVYGDTLYAHINDGTSAASTFIKYFISDPSLGGGTWETGTSMPTALVGGSMVECDGILYYMGGGPTGVSESGNIVYAYDPNNGQWTTKSPMPIPLAGHGAVSWGDSVIFVMGGPWSTSTTTNLDIYYYRPATDTWGTITGASALPSGAGRRAFAIGIQGNKIIIAGGYAGDYIQTAYLGTIGANATEISWTQIDNIPGVYGLSRCGGTAIDDLFFLVGGEKSLSAGYSDTTYVYDFKTNLWRYSFPGKPIGTSNIFGAVDATQLSGDTIVLFTVGAYNGISLATFDVAKYIDPFTVKLEDIDIPTLRVFPNPAQDNITIRSSLPDTEVTIEIYNTLGQLLNTYRVYNSKSINVADYAPGIYTIILKEKIEMIRFIKQ